MRWWMYGLMTIAAVLATAHLWPSNEPIVAADTPPEFKPFQHWPPAKPDAVLVLSGQTFGYLSPCGCSRPQKGGLERRYNFMQGLRAKGWPVVGLDLGDLSPPKKVNEQDLLKYKTMMEALKTMGYAAVGLGKYDFNHGVNDLLGQYALQQGNERPSILAANMHPKGQTRVEAFPPANPNGTKPMIDDAEVIDKDLVTQAAMIPIGVVGTVGGITGDEAKDIDKSLVFDINAKKSEKEPGAILMALEKLDKSPIKPAIKVLLYAGSKDEAERLAKDFPQFQLILCQSVETEPPSFPSYANNDKTLIVQVGHRGQNIGCVGVFKTATGYDLKYQLVPLTEDFLTAKGQEAKQPILQQLEAYTETVRKNDLLAKYTAKPLDHPAMIKHPNSKITYVGADKCITCHPQEGNVWKNSKHSHAYDALVKLAANPGQRQFDGDCVSCHSTGFDYKTGYRNEKDTAHLKHNGCENCHGPGSAHAAEPNNKDWKEAMLWWRETPQDKMPAKATLEALAQTKPGEPAKVQLTPREQKVWNAVNTMCMKCHDGENDPKFDLNVNFPKVWHSGFKAAAQQGLPGNAK